MTALIGNVADQRFPRGRSAVWLLLSLAIIALDQATKAYITRHFGDYETTSLLPILDITLVYNKGAAFSFLATAAGWQRWLFMGLAGSVSIGITVWLVRLPRGASPLLTAGLSLVLGGALGNLIDRIHREKVVDFIHFHWDQAYFPAFNVADSAITVGAGLLLLDALFEKRHGQPPEPST